MNRTALPQAGDGLVIGLLLATFLVAVFFGVDQFWRYYAVVVDPAGALHVVPAEAAEVAP